MHAKLNGVELAAALIGKLEDAEDQIAVLGRILRNYRQL